MVIISISLGLILYFSWTSFEFRITETPYSVRLVFTSDGVGFGVIIRNIARYDLVKSNNAIVSRISDCAYHSIAYDQVTTRLSKSRADAEENGDVLIGLFFLFRLRLRKSGFH